MFGYACTDTDVLMPMPIVFAHALTRRLSQVRKDGTLDFLRPDGKSQVTVEYHEHVPVRIDAVVVSSQHCPEATEARYRMLTLIHAMTFGLASLSYRTESMHGAGSPQAQKIMIERQVDMEYRQKLARSISGIDAREDVLA